MLINFLKQNIMESINKARALHYVFKIGDRAANSHFFRNILGMQVLRHEEFKEGCEAQCNGPYENRWSKTMVGYGPEKNHFVIELTYNYGVQHYDLGNEFAGITIKSRESLERAKKFNYPIYIEHDMNTLVSPDGYKFYIIDKPQPTDTDPVCEVSLLSSNMQNTRNYWHKILNMQIVCDCEQAISLNYGPNQAKLRFQKSKEAIDRAQAYGRIAFSVPYAVQPLIAKKIEEINGTVLKPLISLDTPGKATVRVIILADPDDHEICFVDEEGFSELSKVEEDATKDLDKYIKKDPFQNKASIVEAALQSS